MGPAVCHVHWEFPRHVRASINSRDSEDHQAKHDESLRDI
jgi:hypothetical protein